MNYLTALYNRLQRSLIVFEEWVLRVGTCPPPSQIHALLLPTQLIKQRPHLQG